MRRLATALAVGVCALSACGGNQASSPLDEGLSYLPKDAPFAAAIETDLSGSQYKSLDALAEKFPFSGQIKNGLRQQLEQSGRVSFQNDIRPLLGNPIVVGGVDPRAYSSGQSDDQFVAAIQVKDKAKLDSLIEKQNVREQGERAGAKIYSDGGSTVAVKDDVLIVAGSRGLLDAALDRREGDDHLTEEDFDKGLEGLPQEGLLRLYANVGALLRSDPDTADARKIKWVNALRTLGMTAVARNDAIGVDFRLATEGDLSERDLPIASGDAAPPVVRRPGEIAVGLRDPAQVIRFGEAAGQAVNPSGYGQYTAAKRRLEQQLGVSIDDDVIGQLGGDTALSASVDGKFAWRAELKDAAAFERTLARVAARAPRAAAQSGAGGLDIQKPSGGDGLYRFQREGEDTIWFGVLDEVLVVASDPARARVFAAASPSSVPGAKGALATSTDAQELAAQVLRRAGPELGLGGAFGSGLFTRPLGDLTGSARATPEALSGSFDLKIE